MNIFVASLSFRVQSEELKQIFEQYGEVESAKVIMDHETGRSRGFAFVEMPNEEEGNQAIEELNGKSIQGKEIVVKQARPREEGQRRSFDGGNRRGGFDGGERRFSDRNYGEGGERRFNNRNDRDDRFRRF